MSIDTSVPALTRAQLINYPGTLRDEWMALQGGSRAPWRAVACGRQRS
ncbi:hypothetical protein VXE65_32640 [Mycolicibacterium conceptionense]